VDLTQFGTQPLERDNFVIVFNGMIYNYREIRQQLIAEGYNFKTNTDTEVVVTGWAAWKQELLPRLIGMFAFAIWNKEKQSLSLVRDRFGKKPLYYRNWQNSFAFGSRLDTVESLTESAKLTKDALSWLLTLKYLPDPFTAADDIHKVPAGHILDVSQSGQVLTQWYEFKPNEQVVTMSLADQKMHLLCLMKKAVTDRLIADVPVACFLSGGIDSAIVAALARKSGPLNTFTATFDDQLLDESVAARKTAAIIGSEHREVRLTGEMQLDMLDRLLSDALDEPFGDSSALPALAVSDAMKKHATVALSGDGADELFGGYRKYQGELVVRAWQRLPGFLRGLLRAIIERFPSSRNSRIQDLFRQAHKFSYAADLPALERHAVWMELIVADDHLLASIGKSKHQELVLLLEQVKVGVGCDYLSAVLLRDFHIVLISDMLVKVDRTSMECGLEVRSPFLDHRVAEMSLAIDGDNKVSWGIGKKILRESFQNELPPHLLSLPKQGFEIPLNKWLAGPLHG
jgi:asparagine synthase (glutamine-hydrolysing)